MTDSTDQIPSPPPAPDPGTSPEHSWSTPEEETDPRNDTLPPGSIDSPETTPVMVLNK